MENIDAVRQRFTLLEGVLDQRTRRLVAAAEALTLGWGGVTWVARATGFSRRTIQQGIVAEARNTKGQRGAGWSG